jgi:S1-C subfamily serine protease
MSIKSMVLVAFLFVNVPVAAISASCGQPDYIVRESIVRVEGDNIIGSGVIIGTNRILTAAHVIEELDEIFVVVNGKRIKATVVSVQAKLDLALLLVPTGDVEPLNLLVGSLQPEDDVWAMGYALGDRLVAMAGEYKGSYDRKLYSSASVNYGQSGGGLVSCSKGKHVLAGMLKAFGAVMINGKLERREDFSVAASSQDIRHFVASNQQVASVLESFIDNAP